MAKNQLPLRILRSLHKSLLILGIASCCTAAMAAETRTYTYNSRGELLTTTVSGGTVSGLQTTISYDLAGNRVTYVTTGSSASNPLVTAMKPRGVTEVAQR